MVASELINKGLPVVHSKDSLETAIDLMDEYQVSHFPIVDNDEYIGLLSRSYLFDLDIDEEAKLSPYINNLPRPFIYEDQHLFDVLKLVDSFKISLIPVLNKQDKFIGWFSTNSIVQLITSLSAVQQSGGIIILEMQPADYTLTQIAQIVEGNDAKILACYTTPTENGNSIAVTLKINREDLSAIIQTFHRYNYTIKATFHQSEFDDDMRRRFDLFMNYINM